LHSISDAGYHDSPDKPSEYKLPRHQMRPSLERPQSSGAPVQLSNKSGECIDSPTNMQGSLDAQFDANKFGAH
jgi:hypothetical protein